MVLRGFIGAVIALPLSGCGFFDSDLLRACETAFVERLRSPRSYERIEVSERSESISADEYFEETSYEGRSQIVVQADRSDIESGRSAPRRLSALVTYEAHNAYGTSIRDRYLCEFYTLRDDPQIYDFSVRINGETNADRLIREIRERRS